MYQVLIRTKREGRKPLYAVAAQYGAFDHVRAETLRRQALGEDAVARFVLQSEQRNYSMQHHEVKAALGLPPKLPTYRGEPKVIGALQGVNILDFGQPQRGRRAHRLYAQVGPNQYVPLGRLHQYHLDLEDR